MAEPPAATASAPRACDCSSALSACPAARTSEPQHWRAPARMRRLHRQLGGHERPQAVGELARGPVGAGVVHAEPQRRAGALGAHLVEGRSRLQLGGQQALCHLGVHPVAQRLQLQGQRHHLHAGRALVLGKRRRAGRRRSSGRRPRCAPPPPRPRARTARPRTPRARPCRPARSSRSSRSIEARCPRRAPPAPAGRRPPSRAAARS